MKVRPRLVKVGGSDEESVNWVSIEAAQFIPPCPFVIDQVRRLLA